MTLQDPVAVYNAATNVEAHLVRSFLVENGVEAFVSEDLSPGGLWMFGLLPEIHKPQVWINRGDLDRAAPILGKKGGITEAKKGASLIWVSRRRSAVHCFRRRHGLHEPRTPNPWPDFSP